MPDEQRPDRCETCRFWEVSEDDNEFGECRRNPPQLDIIPLLAILLNARDKLRVEFSHDSTPPYDDELRIEDYHGAWPKLWGEDWCGEWKPKDGPREETP